MDVYVSVLAPVITPDDKGAAPAVGDCTRCNLISISCTYGHPIERPDRFTAPINPLGIDCICGNVSVVLAKIFPVDNCAL